MVTCNQGHYGLPLQRTGAQNRTCGTLKWGPSCWGCNRAEVHCIVAIKEAEVCHVTVACIPQQTHRENMLALECEAKAEEGQDHQPFMEAFGWPYKPVHPKLRGTNVPPSTPDWWCATSHHSRDVGYHPAESHIGQRMVPAASILIVSETLVPQRSDKC